jgi:hypothetical protein
MIAIRKTNICTTDVWIFDAWEPSRLNDAEVGHSTIMSDSDFEDRGKKQVGNTWWGRIGTKRLPAEFDALPPMSDARYDVVHSWQADEYTRAENLIKLAFPEACDGKSTGMGQIEIRVVGSCDKLRQNQHKGSSEIRFI